MTFRVLSVEPGVVSTLGGALLRVELADSPAGVPLEARVGERPVRSWPVPGAAAALVVSVPPLAAGEQTLSVRAGEATASAPLLVLRPDLGQESTLHRVIRRLLQLLRERLIDDVSLAVSVDHVEVDDHGVTLIALAKLPSLALAGPTIRVNRFHHQNTAKDELVDSAGVVSRAPSRTVDLVFTVTGASRSTAELLAMLAAWSAFSNRSPWLELMRDPERPALGSVRWELEVDREVRTQLGEEVRVFTSELTVVGFDLDDGLPLELAPKGGPSVNLLLS